MRKYARIVRVESTRSTNEAAWEELAGGAPDGTVVIAGQQTGGRGRLGRVWGSPPGNLYLSILRKLREPLERAGIVALLAGIALCRAVNGLTGVKPALKWPNDVLVDGLKLAGILLEAREGWQVVGVGLNVNTKPEDLGPGLSGIATTLLAVTGRSWPLEQTGQAFLDAFYDLEADFVKTRALNRNAYMEYFPFVSTQAAVYYANREVRGTIAGVDDSGALLLQTPSGISRITSGEVVHVRPQ